MEGAQSTEPHSTCGEGQAVGTACGKGKGGCGLSSSWSTVFSLYLKGNGEIVRILSGRKLAQVLLLNNLCHCEVKGQY